VRRYTRRTMLQATSLGAFGAAVAAVVGCGDSEQPLPAPSTEAPRTDTSTATATASAITSTVVRYNPDLHMIVDKRRALPDGYIPPNLQAVPSAWDARDVAGQQLRADVITALQPMVGAAKSARVDLRIKSAFRSYNEQVRTFNYWVGLLGEAQARRESAEPGHSEHQLGATVDFADPANGWELLESFAESPSGRWLADHAHEFGFALSYPRNGEAITGYIYEPWHFRFIGVAPALEWRASGKTLVEYLEILKARG
jgi:zinc D-Ala-D-Ala carboxypeptidase